MHTAPICVLTAASAATLLMMLNGAAAEPPATPPAPKSDAISRDQAAGLLARSACAGPSILSIAFRPGEPPPPLFDGLPAHSMEITTSSPLAQKYFDQGLSLSYGFNHAEAARAFRYAAELDPDCAMAHWGLALVLGPNINAPMDPAANPEAHAAAQRALSLAAGCTPRERACIEALVRRYSLDPAHDRAALDAAYANAMRRVQAAFADDPDIAMLFVESVMDLHPWDFFTPDGRPRPWTPELIEITERVLASHPDHCGAIHFYIHLVEASTTPERALPWADRLGELAPAAGHLVHMPSHIYLRVGRYDDAVQSNLAAVFADESYIATCRAEGIYPAAYYPHNIHFIWAAAMMQGNRAASLDAAHKVASKVTPDSADAFQFFLIPPLLGMVRFGQWQEILAEPQPDASLGLTTGIWHFARGMAHAALADHSAAQEQLDLLRQLIPSEGVETSMTFMTNTPREVLAVAAALLEGQIALAAGNHDAAISAFETAVRLEDAQNYNEPENFTLPSRHFLGDALLRAGRPVEAEAVFWADLRDHPENGWALRGLVAALEAQGEARAAERQRVDERFKEAWSGADITITSSRL